MATAKEYEIVDVRSTSTRSDGTPFVTKAGAPYWRTDIQIPERPGVWINGLAFKDPSDWKGTKKRLVLSVANVNGRDLPNFKLAAPPSKASQAADEQLAVLREIAELLRSVDGKLDRLVMRPS